MRISTIILISILIMLFGILIYLSSPLISELMEEQDFIIIYQEESVPEDIGQSYEGRLQFYPKMRFNHLPITYYIELSCDEEREDNMLAALSVLTEKAGISFKESGPKADIFVACSEKSKEEGMFIAGEGGPTKIINTSLYNIIEKGNVIFFHSLDCKKGNYNVELHELLHVFGFEHSTNQYSVMYNTTHCNQKITQDIIDELINLYKVEPLPDLYFEEVKAKKQGFYLDIDFQVKNQGLILAKNVSVSIFDNEKNEKIKDFNIGDLDYGASKILSAQNIKATLSVDELRIVIDSSNQIRELEKRNNVVRMGL